MKSIPLATLLASLSLGVLAGCASPPATSESSVDSPAPAVEATTAAESEPVQAEPTETEESSSSWQILREVKVKHKTTVAGFLSDQFGLTAGYAGEVHYTTDGGESWPRAQNQSACRFGLDIVDENLAWTVGNPGNVRVSTNGGKTWHPVTNLPRLSHFISFVDAQTGWAGTQDTLWATNDGGQTWTEVVLPEGIKDLVGVSLATATDGYLIDLAGSLYVTADGGKTWTTQSLPPVDIPLADMAHGAAIRFLDREHGIVVANLAGGGQSKVIGMQTVDGGKTWEIEELPVKVGYLFLSHDGTVLTVTNLAGGEIVVLGNPNVQNVLLSSQ